jgi:hypothetical protein
MCFLKASVDFPKSGMELPEKGLDFINSGFEASNSGIAFSRPDVNQRTREFLARMSRINAPEYAI